MAVATALLITVSQIGRRVSVDDVGQVSSNGKMAKFKHTKTHSIQTDTPAGVSENKY